MVWVWVWVCVSSSGIFGVWCMVCGAIVLCAVVARLLDSHMLPPLYPPTLLPSYSPGRHYVQPRGGLPGRGEKRHEDRDRAPSISFAVGSVPCGAVCRVAQCCGVVQSVHHI